MRYIQNYAYHKGIQNSPPNLHPYPQELPTIYRTYTDESFTPDYRSDEGYINYSSSRIPHQEHVSIVINRLLEINATKSCLVISSI